MTTESNGSIGPTDYTRDASGRFAPGTRGGPGSGQGRRIAAYRDAVRDAVEPEQLARVVEVLLGRALDGDIPAARELLDRVLGRPRPASEPVDLALPTITNSRDAVAAMSTILAALPELGAEDAARVGGLVQVALRATEIAAFEERLDALEQRLRLGQA